MRASAVETMRDFYGTEPNVQAEWGGVLSGITGSHLLLEQIVRGVDDVGAQLADILARTGLFDTLNVSIAALMPALNEQIASTFLRNKFGAPSPTAPKGVDVSMDLAGDEVERQAASLAQARTTEQVIHSEAHNVLSLIDAVIVAKMAELQKEIEQRDQELARAAEATKKNEAELGSTFTAVRQPVDFTLAKLRTDVGTLGRTRSEVVQVFGTLQQGIEYRIHPIATQSIAPTQLRPELAA